MDAAKLWTTTAAVRRHANTMWEDPRFGWLLWVVGAVLCVWWRWHVPSSGKAVALLAVVAAVMSIRAELEGWAKFCWILLLFGYVFIESRAIDNDRIKSQDSLTASFKTVTDQANENLKTTLNQSNANLKSILDDEHKSFALVLDSQQKQFAATLGQVVRNDQNENKRFSELLEEQRELFSKQTELSAFMSGRLLPDDETAPPNACDDSPIFIPVRKDSITIITKSNAFITNVFPHTIVQLGNHRAIGITHQSDGSLAIILDIRDSNGRISVRLDENGLRAAPGTYILRPSKSTVVVEDSFGNEIFHAHYLNKRTFVIEGYVMYQNKKYPIDNPQITRFCSAYNGGPDIAY